MCCHLAAQLPGGSSCIIMLHPGTAKPLAGYEDQSKTAAKYTSARHRNTSSPEQRLKPSKGKNGRGYHHTQTAAAL